MADASAFLGTWASEGTAPFASHMMTWTRVGGKLVGRWTISAADEGTARRARALGRPDTLESTMTDIEIEAGRLLFAMHGGPMLAEFRLLDDNRAVLGTAADRLPSEYRSRLTERAIEGHRVYFTRHAPPEVAEGV